MEQLDVLKVVIEKLQDLGIEYMLSGSVALNFYGQPRMTRDIDIVVVIDPPQVSRFVDAFRNEFYVDTEMVLKEVTRKGMFNVIHNEHIVKVDFIVRKDTGYDVSAFSRHRAVSIGDLRVNLIAPEDLVLNKLRWAREGESEVQTRDVKSILRMTKEMDYGYLQDWAQQLGIDKLLEKCLHD
jgi:hypothetical protein